MPGGGKRGRRIVPPAPQREIEEELAYHIEARVAEYMAGGLGREEAERAARERLGQLDAVRAECTELLSAERRAAQRRDWLEDLRQDLRFGARAALRTPLFTMMAVVTLALGIGANAAVFGVVKSVLLDSLPYTAPDRLVWVFSRFATSGDSRSSVSPGAYADLSERAHSFGALAGFNFNTFDLTYIGTGQPRTLRGALVVGPFFETLGVRAALGRTLTESDATRAVVMLSHATWQREFGGDVSLLGRTIRLGGESYEVVGVLPPAFTGPMGPADVWLALDLAAVLATGPGARDQHWLGVVGRLAPGGSLSQAQRELDRIAADLEREHPATDAGRTFNPVPLREVLAGDTRTPLLVLMACAALVLLVACANLAGALLSRTLARRREFAVRLSLGAGRGRLTRQLLTEALLLALAGAGLGLLLAALGLAWFRHSFLHVLPPYADARLDAGAMLAAAAVALLTALAFGAAPALAAARSAPQGTLREAARGSTESRRARRLRGALVAAQIALSLSLLAGAGLLARSLWTMLSAPPGFEPRGVLAARVPLEGTKYDDVVQRVRFYERAEQELRALPGVSGVASASQLPGPDMNRNALSIEGSSVGNDGPVFIRYMAVSDDFFALLRIPLRTGRTFDARDLPDGEPVIVINEAMARRYWPGGDAVGARLRISPQTAERWGTVIGIVADQRTDPALAQPEPVAYASIRQDPFRNGRVFLLRSGGSPLAQAQPFQAAVASLDPEVALRDLTTLEAWLAERVAPRRLPAVLMLAFAGLTLVLASVGVYAMFAAMAAARAAEFGIRMALGSTPGAVAALVLRQGAAWLGAGLAAGMAGVLVIGSLLAELLYGISPRDPLALGAAVFAIALCAMIALLMPVRRAARVDPVTVLR